MSKYVTLVTISLLTSFTTLLIVVYRIVRISQGATKAEDMPFFYLQFNWLSSDILINILCFMTQFRYFGNDTYYRYCTKFDHFCKNAVKFFTIRHMVVERQKSSRSNRVRKRSMIPTTTRTTASPFGSTIVHYRDEDMPADVIPTSPSSADPSSI